jgi:CBS domain-containing protein
MINRKEWPQLRAGTSIRDAIRILRILTEDEKLLHGHSTPIILDDDYHLLGFIRLVDLLRNIRHLCDDTSGACELGDALNPVQDLVIPFEESINPDQSILEALDIMTNRGISLLPVMKDDKFLGIIKLSDVFNKVAALLFDSDDRAQGKGWIWRHLHD